MRSVQALLGALLAALLLQSAARAIIVAPTRSDVERALKLAQARELQRAAFHKPYLLQPGHPELEQLEVITEYRRYVLAVEEQLRMGNWLFAQSPRDAQEKLTPWRERLTLVARLRFHPQNVLIGIPPYEIRLGNPDLAPLDLTRTPINALLSGRRGDFNAPLVGATLEAVFNSTTIGQAARPVILSLEGKPVVSVTVDFATLD
jgi:hypothetical protein